MKIKYIILVLSFIILWILEVFKSPYRDIYGGLGSALFYAIVWGIVVGGFVLFNIFLFLHNIFKPDNKLKFNIVDKIITGLWFLIIFRFFEIL